MGSDAERCNAKYVPLPARQLADYSTGRISVPCHLVRLCGSRRSEQNQTSIIVASCMEAFIYRPLPIFAITPSGTSGYMWVSQLKRVVLRN